jgi:YegS/Rv2252/BmrU family lipid kinase
MAKRKMLFIYNPRAGKGQIRNHLSDIIDIFVKAGNEVTIYPTQCAGDAVRVAAEKAKRYDCVVCSGGDGTLDEVVTGIMRSSKIVPVGYVPAGSTNDFANSLRLPRNMLEAADVVVHGNLFQCDIGSFNEDTFVYIAAFGLFTDVSYETKQEYKNVLGHMAYLLEGMKRLSAIRSYQMKVTAEEMEIEGDFIFGMITNSMSVGGFKRITGKYVELNDGLFEVTLIKRPTNPIELNQILADLVNRNIDTDQMYCFKTASLCLESEEEIPWTLDGEFGGRHCFVQIRNQKQQLAIRVPKYE